MSISGYLLQLATRMEPMVPVMVFTAGVTAVVVIVFAILATDVWIDERKFRVLGVFFGLNGYDSYRLSLGWIRVLMTLFYVVAFRNLELETNFRQVIRSPQFSLYLLIGILYVADFKRPMLVLKNLAWFLVICCGLFATSIMCGYMRTLPGFSLGAFIVYACMGTVVFLLSVYLFFMEVEGISRNRKINPEKEYDEAIRR